MLNSNASGMRFNDSTTLVSNSVFSKMKYIDLMGKGDEPKKSEIFEQAAPPEMLTKKTKIITYYQRELKSKKE